MASFHGSRGALARVGVFGMAIGYPNTESSISDKQIKPRLPMREVLHMQRWSEERQKDSVASYNKSLGKFYFEELKLGRKGWG